MIYLRKVSKYHLDSELGHEVVLRDASFAIPTNRFLALITENTKAASTILLMLTGSRLPETGQVDRGRVRCSPVMNAGGGPSTLIPLMTVEENIAMLAARFGIDYRKLAALVEGALCLGSAWQLPVRKLDGAQRRSLEVAAVSALPFDCYFVDRLQHIESKLIWKLLHSARLRGAGVIFSTDRASLAQRLNSVEVLVSNGQLHWAKNLQETIKAHGQAG